MGGRYASAEFAVTTDLYPWGLLGLASVAVLLTVFTASVAVRRSAESRRARRRTAGAVELPAFVAADLLAGVLAAGAADDARPGLVSTRAVVRALAGEAALVDAAGLRMLADALHTSPLDEER